MKKTVSILLALTLVLSMCACGAAQSTTATKKETSTSPIGYPLKIDGVTFGIGQDAEEVVAKLGACEPVVSESCGDMGGNDYEYPYQDFVIYANDGDGPIRIYCVELVSDMVATAEGISLSATVDEVKEVYGDPTSETATILIYEKAGMQLIFFLKDSAVDAIQYREK